MDKDNVIYLSEIEKKAKEGAQKVADSMTPPQLDLKAVVDELESINPDLGLEEIASILSLPDEAFAIIAPVFLDELTKSLNNVNDKLLLAQSLNITGASIEDVQKQYEALYQNIDQELQSIPAAKRDFVKQILSITYNMITESVGISKRTLEVAVEKCHTDAKIPVYANPSDSGADLYALEDITIAPGEKVLVPTGLKFALPAGYEFQVRPKSGRSLKTQLRIANTPGTIDAGYRDELKVIVENIDPPIKKLEVSDDGRITNIEYGSAYTIGKGEKFAQIILMEVPKAAFYEVETVMNMGDNRGGGFGSTGLK